MPNQAGRKRRVYVVRNVRPAFLRPAEYADISPADLVELRKRWAAR